MNTQDVIWRYLNHHAGLRIKSFHRPKMVQGLTLCRHLRLPLRALKNLDLMEGLVSFGPVDTSSPNGPQFARRYARRNGFGATYRFIVPPRKPNRRYLCIKDRPFRKGIYHRPRRTQFY